VFLFCVCYFNVLVQDIWLQGYFCVCVTLMFWISTIRYRATVLCVTVMFCTVQLGRRLLLCVCYCNLLVQYSCVQVYCYVCYYNVLLQYISVQVYCCVCVTVIFLCNRVG